MDQMDTGCVLEIVVGIAAWWGWKDSLVTAAGSLCLYNVMAWFISLPKEFYTKYFKCF